MAYKYLLFRQEIDSSNVYLADMKKNDPYRSEHYPEQTDNPHYAIQFNTPEEAGKYAESKYGDMWGREYEQIEAYNFECYCNKDQGAGYTFHDEHGLCDFCLTEGNTVDEMNDLSIDPRTH